MALRWNDASRTLDLGVHDLLDASDAHIHRGVAISSRARMAAGVAVHREVQAALADEHGANAEVPVKHVVVVRGWTCTIHGRMDGVVEEDGRTVVEEIKSTALDAAALEDAVFPAWERQLALYVHFAVCARLPEPVGRLRAVSLTDGSQRLWIVPWRDLSGEIAAALDAWVFTREDRLAWQARRRQAPVAFAHDAMRPGQEDIAAAAETAVRQGRHLLLEAPTGIGKTAAVLVGVLRAAAALDKQVFWATARTTQQALVEATVREMAARGTPLRAVTLRAREKACLNDVVDCRPEACRFAADYYSRRPPALDTLLAAAHPDADAVSALGRATTLCPYELALDLTGSVDLVVGDYNYVFDPSKTRFRDGWVIVVEEAHQLPERAMGWGSPALPIALVEPARQLGGALGQLATDIGEAIEEAALEEVGEVGDARIVELSRRRWTGLRDRVDEVAWDGAGLDAWVELGRAVISFVDALERAGEETVTLLSEDGLRLFCRDPAPALGPRFASAHASVSISATLSPHWFHRDRCGLPPDRLDTLVVPPPFPPENRRVVSVPGVSTAFRHRARDREAVRDAIARTIAAVPGNVAVFFGSFEQLADLLPDVDGRERLVQTARMGEGERARLLARMREPGPPRVLGAVLGGIFAEGVDLPGDALRAAIIVGPALPPPSAEQALLQVWYEERHDQGFDLAYVHPGMTKVVQAAGRVVRGPEDRGLVVLLCQRFLRHAFTAYFPAWWDVTRSRRPWEEAEEFFR